MTDEAGRRPGYSIVIPVHNEAEILETEVRGLLAELAAHGLDFEMLLVENGSTDSTPALVEALAQREPRIRALHLPVGDYGEALRRGMAAALGELVVNFDIDYSSVDFALEAGSLASRYGIVVGSKIMGGSHDRRSPLRRLVSRVFILFLRVLFDRRIDATHGMKVFRHDVVESYLPDVVMGQDLFDTELVIRARRGGVAVGAVPVVCEEKRKARSSILRRIPRSVRGLLTLRLILWKEQFGGSRHA